MIKNSRAPRRLRLVGDAERGVPGPPWRASPPPPPRWDLARRLAHRPPGRGLVPGGSHSRAASLHSSPARSAASASRRLRRELETVEAARYRGSLSSRRSSTAGRRRPCSPDSAGCSRCSGAPHSTRSWDHPTGRDGRPWRCPRHCSSSCCRWSRRVCRSAPGRASPNPSDARRPANCAHRVTGGASPNGQKLGKVNVGETVQPRDRKRGMISPANRSS
jgi:hypothetical protein